MFRLLGPVQAQVDGTVLDAGQPRQRAVLAALLVDAGRSVPMGTLIERVWDDGPPPEARNVIYGHLSRIRGLLARATELGADAPHLRRNSTGYVLDVAPDLVDLHRFRRLADSARGQTDIERRASMLRQALDLWTGTPLVDLSGAWPDRIRERLSRDRHLVFLDWGEAMLRLDHPEPVLPEAHDLQAEHPHSEPLAALLIRALYASGRAAEALDVYGSVRRRLGDDLGTDPGLELQQIHRAVLRAEPDSASPTATRPVAAPPAPAQLLPGLTSWTGRTAEIEMLTRLTAEPGPPGAARVAVLHGMAGVGKTALAVHVGHRVADRFDAGQVFLDLDGFTFGVDAMRPELALDRMLRSIGVPGRRIPESLEERAALWRAETAGRRLLLILDNAADEEQLRPLLPTTNSVAVLVTTRRRLTLFDVQDAQHLSLDPLSGDDAVALFTRVAGPERLGNESPTLIAEAAGLCGHLPLGLRLLATRLRSRPAWRLSDVLRRLRAPEHRLDELRDGPHEIVPILHESYDQLGCTQKRVFRLLGLHPGPAFDAHAIAALTALSVAEAEHILESLVDEHLLESPSYGRYSFHDLIRTAAACLVRKEEERADQDNAIDRLTDPYLNAASSAMDAWMVPTDQSFRRPVTTPSPAECGEFGNTAEAHDWLETERANLIASASLGPLDHTIEMSAVLHDYLRDGCYYPEAFALAGSALEAARTRSDDKSEALALFHLGSLNYRVGRSESATEHYQMALSRLPSAAAGVEILRARILHHLGHVLANLGRVGDGRVRLQQAADLYRRQGSEVGEGRVLSTLARWAAGEDRLDDAETLCLRAIAVSQRADDLNGQASGHLQLASVYWSASRLEEAQRHASIALEQFRALGDRTDECLALASSADIAFGRGRHTESLRFGRLALELATELEYDNGKYEGHVSIGIAMSALDPGDLAVDHLRKALLLAQSLSQPNDEARAHKALTDVLLTLGRHEDADHHRKAAQEIRLSFE